MKVYGIILAGGDGERFWPMSTAKRPKQFVDIFGGKPLIRHAVDRLEGLIPPCRILVITASRFVAETRKALPMVPRENIIGEPCRRDTAAAVAVAVGLVKKLGGVNAVGCILTADHLMKPVVAFRATLKDAIHAAAKTDSIVTMGIPPTFAATSFGYIEEGARVDFGRPTVFHRVKRFVEKPDAKTAARYLKSGRFRWNSGMFIWRVASLEQAFLDCAADFAGLIDAVSRSQRVEAVLKRLYPELRSISVDFAVMEKTQNILVANGVFKWDDVGSWLALPNHFTRDDAGNTMLGRVASLDVGQSIVVSTDDQPMAVIGVDNVVVVHTAFGTLVAAKNRVQDIKKLISTL